MIFRSNSSLTDGNEVTDCPIRWCPPGLRVRVEVSWPQRDLIPDIDARAASVRDGRCMVCRS